MRQVVFYRTASGTSPVEAFLDTLAAKTAQKVLWVLRLVEEMPAVPAEYFRKLAGKGDIWEVRVQRAGDAVRLLGFIDDGRFIVLTNGFMKKTEKAPPREIDLALKRRRDYLARRQG